MSKSKNIKIEIYFLKNEFKFLIINIGSTCNFLLILK